MKLIHGGINNHDIAGKDAVPGKSGRIDADDLECMVGPAAEILNQADIVSPAHRGTIGQQTLIDEAFALVGAFALVMGGVWGVVSFAVHWTTSLVRAFVSVPVSPPIRLPAEEPGRA